MFNKISIVFLLLTSISMLYKGAFIAYHTSGIVRGGEFQMLITISNQFAFFMVWLASLALFLISKNTSKPSQNDVENS